METKTYLNRYRVSVDRSGIPIVIRQSADEATLKAEDMETATQVAVQVQSVSALGAAERAQLQSEARAAQQIDHSSIPRLRDFGIEGDEVIYVTEYFEGITADAWVKTNGPMRADDVLRIAAQAVSALVAAGLHGIIHHAVTPANIMLVPAEKTKGKWPLIKVLNFLGVAPAHLHSGAQESGELSAADFASPEQSSNGPITFRSELYSLARTLWFLLKGTPLNASATAVRSSGLPAPVWNLLAPMLAENPAERPADPLILQEQIQNALAALEQKDSAPSGPQTTATPAPPRPASTVAPAAPRHSAWKPVAVAALLLGLATLAAFLLAQNTGQRRPSVASAPELPELRVENPSIRPDLPALLQAPEESPAPPVIASQTVPPLAPEALPSLTEIASADGRSETSPQPEAAPLSSPLVASMSPSPEAATTPPEARSEMLSLQVEPPAPAEGPLQNMQVVAALPAEPVPPSDEEPAVQEDALVRSLTTAPEKKAKRAAKTPAKNRRVAKALPLDERRGGYLTAPHHRLVTVGHI
ncbi:MAG TPA: protein kinase, partial [Chthoniobacterales bacterium]|nr:protein kinase [Chthoniobacterales bacterium]